MLNLRFVIRQLGLVMGVLSLSMLVIALWSAFSWARDNSSELAAMKALLASVGVGMVITLISWAIGRQERLSYLGRREAMLLVAVSWYLGAALSALPFFLWAMLYHDLAADHPFTSIVSCLFESVSGLTTTGATVLTTIEEVPRGMLMWRATTHWLGGLGIVVLFVAVLPNVGVGGKRMFMAEVTGPTKTGLRPRIQEAARTLLLIYIGLNVIEIVLLRLCGLSWFDAICESFATIATGGFSTKTASTAGYDSLAAEIVIIIFMFLSGANFGLYFQLAKGRWRNVLVDPELRFYAIVTIIGAVLVVSPLIGKSIILATGDTLEPGVAPAVRHGLFNFMSLRTNTGFATADINPWGFVPAAVIMFAMSMGACSGSTAGGIKLVRCLVALKVVSAAVTRSFRPSIVRPIRLGASIIDDDVRAECLTYVLLYLIVLMAGGFAVHVLESNPDVDIVTAFSASAACLSNSGPGLGLVGTIQNYGWMTDASKLVLCAVMLLGRLEVYALVAVVLPRFWHRD